MALIRPRGRLAIATLAGCIGLLSSLGVQASSTCPDEQPTKQVPTDLDLCTRLEPIVRAPSALPLNEYEKALGDYLGAMCHRNEEPGGWKVDKRVRDTRSEERRVG